MSAVNETVQHYLDAFARQACLGEMAPWVHEIKQEALARFAASGFPTARDENWKYTDLRPLAKRKFVPATPGGSGFTAEAYSRLDIAGLDAYRMTFINGRLSQSPADALTQGVRVIPMAQALQAGDAELRELLAGKQHEPFASLNTAFLRDGVLLRLEPGAVLDKPLHLRFVNSGDGDAPGMIHPRIAILAGAGSQATVIEHFIGLDDGESFINAVTDIRLAAGAGITHYAIQEQGRKTFHLGTMHVLQQKDSRYAAHNFMLGGNLARLDTRVQLVEPGASCRLDGLYLAGGRQHQDNRITVEHRAPHATSMQNYRGVLNGHARGVWNGKVIVHQGADKTDATQNNRNLLLSRHAEIDAKPELEIYADDVKCSHGATVGQLDSNALFYLRTRGVDEATARSLLVFAFADEVLAQVGLPPVRRHIEQRVIAMLPDSERIREFA